MRRLAADKGWKSIAPPCSIREQLLIDALIAPTRIYVVEPAAADPQGAIIQSLAHITGGGLLENIPRKSLPHGAHAHVDADLWPQPRPDDLPAGGRDISSRRKCPVPSIAGVGMVLAVTADKVVDVTTTARNGGGDCGHGGADRKRRKRAALSVPAPRHGRRKGDLERTHLL